MFKRLLSFAVLSMFAASLAQAAARSPQVPVSGTALATFFASQGQTIDVNTQQLDLQVLSVPATTSFEVRTFGDFQHVSFGEYDTTPASPPFCDLVSGGGPTPGYWAIAAFRTNPIRLQVTVISPNNAPLGTVTYANANSAAFGFGVQVDAGNTFPTFYMQDSRNPGGEPKILAYNGTGARTGWTWFACETGAGPGGDFADFIGLVNLSLAPVATQQTSWGRVKRLYK